MSAKNPPIGISLARTFGDKVTEQNVIAAADAVVSRGLKDVGYEYLIIGDGVFAKRRDKETGALVCDSAKFPRGVEYVSEYLHSKGLKLGVVTSAGAITVNGAPGSHEHEYKDAATFASWGVDYISHDVSNFPAKSELPTLIRRMGMALRVTGRDILYSVFSDEENLHKWVRSAGADVFCCKKFADAGNVALPDETIAGYSADYCFNNCGEIVVTADTPASALRTQLATAAIMSSPIIVDCDVTALSDDAVKAITDGDVISIACDAEARPARRLAEGVYCKFLDEAKYALAFINAADSAETLSFYTYDFGLSWNSGYTCEITPVFAGDATEYDTCINVKVGARDAALYRMMLK